MTIEVLDPDATATALSGHRWGHNETLTKIADNLMTVVDTKASVFADGLNESTINALRTKMKRRGVRVAFRKVDVDGKPGHVMQARSIK